RRNCCLRQSKQITPIQVLLANLDEIDVVRGRQSDTVEQIPTTMPVANVIAPHPLQRFIVAFASASFAKCPAAHEHFAPEVDSFATFIAVDTTCFISGH